MLNNPALIHAPTFLSGSDFRIQLYFKDSSKAKYLNIGDIVKDSSGNEYAASIVDLPLQDGEFITVTAVGSIVLPVEDIDYDSVAYTPSQKNYDGEFNTYGLIHFASLHDSVAYEYSIRATWDGSYEENLAEPGDRIVDSKGKEYSIVYIEPVQRFNTFCRVTEVHRTGDEPTVGPSSLFRATTNYGFYQGTQLDNEQHSKILNRDAVVIDCMLKEIADAAANPPLPPNTGIVWRGEWDSITIYGLNDGVSFNGSSYIYTDPISSVNQQPPDPTYWDVLAQSSTGDAHYIYTQNIADTVWNIPHILGKIPSVSVVDTGGSEIIGDIAHTDNNNCVLTFSNPFTGKAYLN